jgi:hypothetical protein
MLRMDQVQVIRHKVLREGASSRRVAHELGLSRDGNPADGVKRPMSKNNTTTKAARRSTAMRRLVSCSMRRPTIPSRASAIPPFVTSIPEFTSTSLFQSHTSAGGSVPVNAFRS